MALTNPFTPVPWCKRASIYEVNVRQYTPEGSLRAFAPHLPRLAKMGVDVLWFMPITPIGVPNRKGTIGSYYACSSYVQVNPEFGSLSDFKKVVQLAHDLGMKVILDWVANHTGYGHDWMETHPEFYLRDSKGGFMEMHGWDDVADLDFSNREMRELMVESMQYWIDECDIDGFRCDMAHLVPLDFWQETRTRLDALKPLFWLAETDNVLYHEVFDASYAWEWMHITENMVKDKLATTVLDKIYYEYEMYLPANGWKLFFTANHDENSWNGTEYEKYGLNALPLAVLAATWPGLFLLYTGQEMPNLRRLLFFEKDELDWSQPLEMEAFYGKLMQLRRRNKAAGGLLAEGITRRIPTGSVYGFAFHREVEGQEILVVVNFGSNAFPFRAGESAREGEYERVFTGGKVNIGASKFLEIPANGYLILAKNSEDGSKSDT